MRIVPINEAEAIIEPYWDGGSSEHPKDKMSLLGHYSVRVPPSVRGGVRQIWCAAQVSFERAGPADGPIVMERSCDLVIDGYDVLRVFASVPDWALMTVRAVIDGRPVTIMEDVRGVNTNDEMDGPVSGSRMSSLSLELRLTEARPASANLLWIGLANKARQAAMEAKRSPYDPEWRGLLRDPDEAASASLSFRPEIGILFDLAELGRLRRKVRSGPLAAEYAALKAAAEGDLALAPERDVGEHIGNPDRRWCRNRDMKKVRTAGLMERLALVGLIERDARMSRMAARMALSAAHCGHWCESIIGVFPGATWHHRSFTEEIYCRACALVLDWAGFCLTAHAKQVIRDAIAMKGLPRIESDFKRMEYIRHMNQGIVFSSGRIFGALALLPAHPRYRTLVDEAERDLDEMIGSYVHRDGGTLEGMGYWSYTFSSVMPVVAALARYRGLSMLAYGKRSPALRKTGDYGLGMLSSTKDGTTYLPANDAHADSRYSPGLVAAYAGLTGKPEWKALYLAMARAQGSGGSTGRPAPDLYHIILAPSPAELRGAPRLGGERFDVFPEVGQAVDVRALEGPGGKSVELHFASGPTYGGHFHEDKGAFILEVGGESVIYDRGVTSYDHPEVNLIGMAARHNLLSPESNDGALLRQPASARGATLVSALRKRGRLMLAGDLRSAWADGLFSTNVRRIYSPAPELFVIDDEVALPRAMALSFRINSPFTIETRGDTLVVPWSGGTVEVRPLNWTPRRTSAGVEGIDCHLHPAHLGILATRPVRGARLLTSIRVIASRAAGDPWEVAVAGTGRPAEGSPAAARVLRLAARPGRLEVRELLRGRVVFSAACSGGRWTAGAAGAAKPRR